MRRLALVLTTLGGGLAACGGSQPQGICPVANTAGLIPAFEMLYPAPGATNVPDDLSGIILGGVKEPNTAIVLNVGIQTVATITSLEIAPTPLPTALPTYAPTPDYLAPISSSELYPASTYTVIWRYTPPNVAGNPNCIPEISSTTLGTFTTK